MSLSPCSTASSEAALPKMFEQLDRFGVPRRISGFMLPLGYSFNLDGSMMYMSFATIFIAQAYGIDLSIGTQILILLTLMISSKGVAAVPRASLVVITGTLAMFDLPVEGVALILAIDQFLDMGRSATNVLGNAIATAVVIAAGATAPSSRSSTTSSVFARPSWRMVAGPGLNGPWATATTRSSGGSPSTSSS